MMPFVLVMALTNVLMYTTPTCPYCHAAKTFLNTMNVSFKEVDVSVDPKAAHDLILKSGQMGVPVLDIDNTIIIGFDKTAIADALQKNGVSAPRQL